MSSKVMKLPPLSIKANVQKVFQDNLLKASRVDIDSESDDKKKVYECTYCQQQFDGYETFEAHKVRDVLVVDSSAHILFCNLAIESSSHCGIGSSTKRENLP